MTKVLESALQDPAQNRILGALPKSDLERLLPDLELVELRLGWIISDAGDHVNFVYFPTSGIVTLMYDLEDGPPVKLRLWETRAWWAFLFLWVATACPAVCMCRAKVTRFDSVERI